MSTLVRLIVVSSRMGAGTSYPPPTVSYHSDRAGSYTIDEFIDRRIYKWFKKTTVEIVVFVEERSVRAHLVEFKEGNIQFTTELDGHIEIDINPNIEIKNKKHKGMCSEAIAKTMFCAIRTYVERFGIPVTYGNVTITSNNAKAAFHCYKHAFAKNGFETDSSPPLFDNIKQWTIHFIKSIKKPLRLVR
jgi:hypothetical protein